MPLRSPLGQHPMDVGSPEGRQGSALAALERRLDALERRMPGDFAAASGTFSGAVTAGNLRIGNDPAHGSDFPSVRNKATSAAGDYALLAQANGATYLNAASGQVINFRTNNVDRAGLDDNGLFTRAGSPRLHLRNTGAAYDGGIVFGDGASGERIGSGRGVNTANTDDSYGLTFFTGGAVRLWVRNDGISFHRRPFYFLSHEGRAFGSANVVCNNHSATAGDGNGIHPRIAFHSEGHSAPQIKNTFGYLHCINSEDNANVQIVASAFLTSGERYKENFAPADRKEVLGKVRGMKAGRFEWKPQKGVKKKDGTQDTIVPARPGIGPTAEELHAAFPETKMALDPALQGDAEYRPIDESYSASDAIGVLFVAVQALADEIDVLKAR